MWRIFLACNPLSTNDKYVAAHSTVDANRDVDTLVDHFLLTVRIAKRNARMLRLLPVPQVALDASMFRDFVNVHTRQSRTNSTVDGTDDI